MSRLYLLDSDTLSLALRGRPGLVERVESSRTADEVGIPRQVWAEAVRGRVEAIRTAADGTALLRAEDGLSRTLDFVAGFVVVPADTVAAAHFDRLRAAKKTWKGGHADLIIACVALDYGATLVTRNTKDFAGVPGLKVENWAD